MTDLPASVGYITVVARGLFGIADSEDGGNQPDGIPLVAKVEFTANNTRPVVAIDETVKTIIPLAKITCRLDSNGDLRPPEDGQGPDLTDADGNLRLVAPLGPGIGYTGWAWTAKFIPVNNAPWAAFTIQFQGEGGDTVDLGEVLASQPVPPATAVATGATGPAGPAGPPATPVSPDGSFGLPAPSGVGMEAVIVDDVLEDFTMNGVPL